MVKYIDKITLIVQILLYLTSVLLVFAKPAKLEYIVLECLFASAAVLVKIVR